MKTYISFVTVIAVLFFTACNQGKEEHNEDSKGIHTQAEEKAITILKMTDTIMPKVRVIIPTKFPLPKRKPRLLA